MFTEPTLLRAAERFAVTSTLAVKHRRRRDMQRTTSGAASSSLYKTIKYARGAAGISLSTTIKYLRRTTSAAAKNGLSPTIKCLVN
jgi:hypothetical protein